MEGLTETKSKLVNLFSFLYKKDVEMRKIKIPKGLKKAKIQLFKKTKTEPKILLVECRPFWV